jgi:peptidoglycan/LPS O-acetylase OafA/YrhL
MSNLENIQPFVEPPKETKPRVRLEYLDGLRGLAALYVVCFHMYFDALKDPTVSIKTPELLYSFMELLFSHGRSSVAIFIVLSGYCLMLPVARSEDGQLRGGFFSYIKRRARRILPPYYGALLLSIILRAAIPENLIPFTGINWSVGEPALNPGAIISHLLLIHNLNRQWIFKINSPMWSVALEWQIYFLFGLVLIPVWRRFGVIPVVIVASIIARLLGIKLVCWWYIILFTIGMVGAIIGFYSKPSLITTWKDRIPWDLIVGLFGGIWLAIISGKSLGHIQVPEYQHDLLLGVAVTCLIISWTRFLTEGKNTLFSGILQLLQSRWLVALGTFSYSLYLIHSLTMAIIEIYLKKVIVQPVVEFLILIALGLPLCILTAYGFHLIFEKRFMSK